MGQISDVLSSYRSGVGQPRRSHPTGSRILLDPWGAPEAFRPIRCEIVGDNSSDRGAMSKPPEREGKLGDIEFDGEITWVSLGEDGWVSKLPQEADAAIRQQSLHKFDADEL